MLTSRSLNSSLYTEEQVSDTESSDSQVEYINDESPRLVSLDDSISGEDSDESSDDEDDNKLLRARASLVSFRTQLVLTETILNGALSEVSVYTGSHVTIPTKTLMTIISRITDAIYTLDQKDIIDAVGWLKSVSPSVSERATVEKSLDAYQSILTGTSEFIDEMRSLVNTNAIERARISCNELRAPRSGSPTLFGSQRVSSSDSSEDESQPYRSLSKSS